MVEQSIFNLAIAGFGAIGGFFMKWLFSELRDLKNKAKETDNKLAQVELLVTGKYITRDEALAVFDKMFEKLDRIDERLPRLMQR